VNKKALIFLPVFSILIFIFLVYLFFTFNVYGEKIEREIGFGDLQLDLFNTFFEGEKDSFYYEKKVEFSILKTTSSFNQYGGLKPDCNNLLEFNTGCEPDYEKYYLELFKEKLDGGSKIEGDFLIFTLDKEYSKKGDNYTFTYKKEFTFKKEININLTKLSQLKTKIKTCLQDNDKSKDCLEYIEIEDNIIIYKIEIEPNFYDNSPLEFKLDLDDTGVITSIL